MNISTLLRLFSHLLIPSHTSCQPSYQQTLVRTSLGMVTGAGAKPLLTATGLATAKLRKLWELADIDKDGCLDLEEFVVAMFLADACISGGCFFLFHFLLFFLYFFFSSLVFSLQHSIEHYIYSFSSCPNHVS